MSASVEELKRRLLATPDALRAALECPLPTGLDGWRGQRLTLTGVGTSQAVASFAQAVLSQQLGLDAVRVPLSTFLAAPASRPGSLVLLSQELSPNARLALAHASRADRSLVLTSLLPADPRLSAYAHGGGQVWTLPPPSERGFLVRVTGPAVAALAMLRLGAALAGERWGDALAQAPDAHQRGLATGFALAQAWPLDVPRAPLLATGWYARALELLSWTWMEALVVEPPPVWEVLELAHGPWQQLARAPQRLLAFTRADDVPGVLEPLQRMCDQVGHSLVAVASTSAAPVCFFEHLGAVQALAVGLLERRPVNLHTWPGMGTDGPLYTLGQS